jgi:nucleotide-binding universal stress UspA family protein
MIAMYRKIAITLDGTPSDRAIVQHIKELAGTLGSEVTLLHVVANASAQWSGSDAGGVEVQRVQTYLNQVQEEFDLAGIPATIQMSFGDPVTEIVKWVNASDCDLLAMGTHGHRLVGDLIHGVTASRVQHHISIPVLLLRAK